MSQGIGEDIAEVINELGTEALIEERTREDGSIIKEKLLEYVSKVMTKPATANTFQMMYATNTTEIVEGDLIYFPTFGKDRYRCMTKRYHNFENETYRIPLVLYRCNEALSIYRSIEKRDANYDVVQQFAPVEEAQSINCLMNDKLYSSEFDNDTQSFTSIDVKGRIAYIPTKFDIRIKDRLIDRKGRLYEVTIIEDHTFENMNVVYTESDTRTESYVNNSGE